MWSGAWAALVFTKHCKWFWCPHPPGKKDTYLISYFSELHWCYLLPSSPFSVTSSRISGSCVCVCVCVCVCAYMCFLVFWRQSVWLNSAEKKPLAVTHCSQLQTLWDNQLHPSWNLLAGLAEGQMQWLYPTCWIVWALYVRARACVCVYLSPGGPRALRRRHWTMQLSMFHPPSILQISYMHAPS